MTFYIQNASTGLVLDVKGGSTKSETDVIMYPHHGRPNQLWTYQNNMIYSKMNGMVLDVSGSTGCIITFPAHGGFNQKWYFDPDLTIRNGNGKVLDVKGAKREAGAKLISYPRNGGGNQHFKMVPVGGCCQGNTGMGYCTRQCCHGNTGHGYGFKG